MSNPIPPSVTPPSPNEWPSTIYSLTGITRDNQAIITSAGHPFTIADIGITSIDFLQVRGMIQINGLPGVIQSVPDSSHFTVNINTTNFSAYTSGGVYNVLTGEPPTQTVGFQVFNTPFQNIG